MKEFIGSMELHDKNKSIVATPKKQQPRLQRKANKKYAANDNTQNQLDSIIEEGEFLFLAFLMNY